MMDKCEWDIAEENRRRYAEVWEGLAVSFPQDASIYRAFARAIREAPPEMIGGDLSEIIGAFVYGETP
jgi:hypothetical protein